MRNAIILAAGKSTRMNSNHSKVVHKIFGNEIIKLITNTLKQCNVSNLVIVVGENVNEVKKAVGEEFIFAPQTEQLGTAHAVGAAANYLKDLNGDTIIVMGDSPLITSETINELFEKNKNHDLTVATTYLENPGHYGRIIRNKLNKIEKITEYKHANGQERLIKEINTGVYCVKNKLLFKFLPYILNAPTSSEYKLTDIVELLVKNNYKVQALVMSNNKEFIGVNTRKELSEVYDIIQENINNNHFSNGVTLIKPETILIGPEVVIEKDVTIHPNNSITGKTIIKEGCVILPNCYIENSEIEQNCLINASHILSSIIKEGSLIGPFSHIRKNSIVGKRNRIGNFVEIKHSVLEENVKSAHLSYLGDSEIGENVNIGCGAVTVNYDGFKKHKTKILKNAFIGCNVNLLAPITVGENTVVAAGSTLTNNVENGDMAIARSFQVTKEGYGQRFYEKRRANINE